MPPYEDASYSNRINTVLKPRQNSSPAVLDLFAGCGGLALGFEAQGFATIGFEMEADYCATYRTNLAGPCYQTILTPGTDYPPADVIIGGPPCQPFSVIGKQKGTVDSRDGFPAFLSAVAKIRPVVCMFENVRGLFYRNKWYLEEIMQSLRLLGYQVEAKLINARNFGVPQNRERVVCVAHRGVFKFPLPEEHIVTAGEALDGLAAQAPHNAKFLTPSMDAYIAKYEKASYCVQPRDLHLDRPSRTVTCRNLAAPTGDMMRVRLPDGRRRRLTVREAARLQSFPDWFEFEGDEESQYYQIGNAVPPMLAYHLAASVRACLESDVRLSEGEISERNSSIAVVAQPLRQLNLLSVEMETKSSRAFTQSFQYAVEGDCSQMNPQPEFITPAKGSREFKRKTPELQQLINETLNILFQFGVPFEKFPARRREKMAMAVLALANVKTSDDWPHAKSLRDGVAMKTREIIAFLNEHFQENISMGSYDDIRRKDLQYPLLAGIVQHSNPDAATNDGTRGYALDAEYVSIMRTYGTDLWQERLSAYLAGRKTLAEGFSGNRYMSIIPVTLPGGAVIELKNSKHNELQVAIIEQFLPRYGFGAEVIYIGDNHKKILHYDADAFARLNLPNLGHEELPDIVAVSYEKQWLLVIEAYHSINPFDEVRLLKMRKFAEQCPCKPIFVTAFLTKKSFYSVIKQIAWETEVWIAEQPDHVVHFDGEKYLAPYDHSET